MSRLILKDTLHLTAFEEYFKTVYGEMAPQNRRAFAAIIRLLAEWVISSTSLVSY